MAAVILLTVIYFSPLIKKFLASHVHSGHGTEVVEVASNETLDIEVFTRSTAGAKFTILEEKKEICPTVEVKHHGTEDTMEPPTFKKITSERIQGPRKVKIKADSNAGRFSRHNYLLVFYHYKR